MTCKIFPEMLLGARAILPLALGVVVYGLAFGLLASQAGFNSAEIGVMGAVVFAGSSQIVAVERMAAGAGVVVAFIAGISLNLRLLLITASIRDLFTGRPLWQRILGAHFSSDENWALTIAWRTQGRRVGYWFLLSAGLVLMLAWVSASVLGVVFASYIPDPQTYALDFAFSAAFIAIARSLWRGRTDAIPWLVAIAVVLITLWLDLFDASLAIILGGLSGAATAAIQNDV